VTFLGADTTTHGDRCTTQRTYGSYAYALPLAGGDERPVGGAQPAHPAATSLDETGGPGFQGPGAVVTYSVHGPVASEDQRALLAPGGGTRRATAHTGSSFSLSLALPAGSYRVATYLLDWDLNGRLQTGVASHGGGTASWTTTNLVNGVYEVYNVTTDGSGVSLQFNGTSPNAVVSGVFVDSLGSPVPSGVVHASSDTTTRGNWVGSYGSLGYALLGFDAPNSGALQPWSAGLDRASGILAGAYTSSGGVFTWTAPYAVGSASLNAFAHSLGGWLPRLAPTDLRAQQFFVDHPAIPGPPSLGDRRRTVWDNGGDNPTYQYAGNPSMYLDVTLPAQSSASYLLSLYFADFDTANTRSESVTVRDLGTSTVYDAARTLSSFSSGTYLRYRVPAGTTIQVQLDHLAGINTVLSGLFLDLGAPGVPGFLGTDTATGSAASLTCAYGEFGYVTPDAQGYAEMPIGGNDASSPAHAYLDETGGRAFGADGYGGEQASYAVHGPVTPSDERGLLLPGGTTRRATAVFGNHVTMTLHLPAGSWDLALYCVDWDRNGRVQSSVVNGSDHHSAGHTSGSALMDGLYERYVVPSNGVDAITINVNLTGGPNAVFSGLFVDPHPSAVTTTAYVGLDTTTAGNWIGHYGSAGYAVLGANMGPTSGAGFVQGWSPASDASGGAGAGSYSVTDGQLFAWTPVYPAEDSVRNAYAFAWTDFFPASGDHRALTFLKYNAAVGGPTVLGSRRATTWDSGDDITHTRGVVDVDVHVPANSGPGSSGFRLSVYLLDWDHGSRDQDVRLLDSAGHVLDSRHVTGFDGGTWLSWSVPAGADYTVQALANAGINAVISGVTLDELPA